MTEPSETPRTDAAKVKAETRDADDYSDFFVRAEVCEQIETELAQATQELADMTALAKRLAGALDALNRTTSFLLSGNTLPKAKDDAWAEYGHESYPKANAALTLAREKGAL